MLSWIFRTKERIVIALITGLTIAALAISLFRSSLADKTSLQQAVMAENYLKAGNYEQAAQAYTKAIAGGNGEDQHLSVGLADAYVGLNEYDRALDALRLCYQKTVGIKVKEKIEEVTSQKADYEYQQTADRAEIYFTNKEYDKAISEYEKAKLIKSKEALSYRRIAEAYIKKGEYGKASQEVREGLELTKDNSLVKKLADVQAYIKKEQYNTLVKKASEYIYQENYDDGIAKYKKAIELLPKESYAYSGLAEAYIGQRDYSEAILLLQFANKRIESKELDDLLSRAVRLKKEEEEESKILNKLCRKLEKKDFRAAAAILKSVSDDKTIIKNIPVYYTEETGVTKNKILIIYEAGRVYLGSCKEDMKDGYGIFLIINEENGQQDYYSYYGEWKNDLPNGEGTAVEENNLKDRDGKEYVSKTVTAGTYYNAYENGCMTKYFYRNTEETGRVIYSAYSGVPSEIKNNDSSDLMTSEKECYAIGALFAGDQPTGEYYMAEPGTIWGVKPFLKNQ